MSSVVTLINMCSYSTASEQSREKIAKVSSVAFSIIFLLSALFAGLALYSSICKGPLSHKAVIIILAILLTDHFLMRFLGQAKHTGAIFF